MYLSKLDITKQLELVEKLYVYDDYRAGQRDGYVRALKWVLAIHKSKRKEQ